MRLTAGLWRHVGCTKSRWSWPSSLMPMDGSTDQRSEHVHSVCVGLDLTLPFTDQDTVSRASLTAKKGSLRAVKSRPRPNPACRTISPSSEATMDVLGAGANGSTQPGPRPPHWVCHSSRRTLVMRSPSIWLSPQWYTSTRLSFAVDRAEKNRCRLNHAVAFP